MYAAALKLQKSDVRIALRARHVVIGAEIKHVRMFDILAIRLGDRLEYGDPLRVPDLLLVLRVPRVPKPNGGLLQPVQSATLLDGFQIGCPEVDDDLGSAANLHLARSWLDECQNTHCDCGTGTGTGTGHNVNTSARVRQAPKLPTRVIDVVAVPPRIVHARDVNNGRPDHGCADYVALSHCWGGPISTLLKTTTAAAFAQALPSSSLLPANFRDAMTVTRALGIRYLWIDSLCIIQDSVQDWRDESRTMGDVYSRATVSLLAMAAEASNVGILFAGDPQSADAEGITVPLAYGESGKTSSEHSPVPFKVSAIFQDEENLRLLCEEAPLSSRGWCLQELVFSTRILFYGKRQIYWYCPSGGYKSAEGMPDGNLYPHNKYPRMDPDLYSLGGEHEGSGSSHGRDPGESAEAILKNYYEFIMAYARRRLTFGTDKFPAVGSFAQQVHRALEKARRRDTSLASHEYLAGVWSGDFRRGLLFYPERMHCAHASLKKKSDYRAPSWSWAITDAPITFLSPHTPAGQRPSTLNLELLSWLTVPQDPKNAYGALDHAQLVVRGRVSRLRRCSKPFVGAHTWKKEEEEGMAWFDNPPTWANPVPPAMTDSNCPLFCRQTKSLAGTDEDMFLSAYFYSEPDTQHKVPADPSLSDCEDQQYTVLLVDLGQDDTARAKTGDSDYDSADSDGDDSMGGDDDDDWELEERLIHCLILRQVQDRGKAAAVDQFDGVFERVGCLVLDWRNRSRIENWRLQTLKLV